MTMTDRRKLAKVKAKSIKIRNIRKKSLIEKGVQAKVIDFFKRDDNSRMMPGKKTPRGLKKMVPEYRRESYMITLVICARNSLQNIQKIHSHSLLSVACDPQLSVSQLYDKKCTFVRALGTRMWL